MDRYGELLRKGFAEYQRYVNPLIAQRARLAGEPLQVVRAEEGVLVDSSGNEIEDFHGTQAFGHRNAHVTARVREYLDSDAPSWYPSRVNPFAGRFARELCERSGYYDNVFLGCTGSDALEAALKLARACTGRPRLLGLRGAYHGCTYGSVSFMEQGFMRDAFGPFLAGAEVLPFADLDALAQALASADVAALVVEPIQGEGGVRELPADYVAAVCELTQAHGTLLIADEVQTGLGRSGRGFLSTAHWPRRPDAVIVAKQLGGGLIATSAMVTTQPLFLRAYGRDFASGESHNNTMGCNAVAAVAGLAALELLTDACMDRVRDVGAAFKGKLEAALAGHPLVKQVRGSGLMLGVVLDPPDHPWLSFEHFGFPELANRSAISPLLCSRLYKRGFFCFTCGHDWTLFRLQPRFDIPEATLDRFIEVLLEELAALGELL